MHPTDFIAPGVSAGAVSVVFMFKMYLDKRKFNGHGALGEIRKLRSELQDKERREEMKPLAEAINRLTMAVTEMHSSHKMQVKVLEVMSTKITGGK